MRVGARWAIPLIVVVSAIVRVISFLDRRDSIYFDRPILDSLWIHQWAEALAAGEPTAAEAYFRAPLYPYLVAGLYRLFGPTTVPVIVAQHLIGIGTAVLLYRIGRREFSAGIGLAAGLGWGLLWTSVLFEGELLIVTLATFLGVAFLDAIGAAGRAVGRGRIGRLVGAGLLLGLAAIARPNFLILVPLGLGVAMGRWPWSGRADGSSWSARLGPALAFGLAVLVPILPVTVRNLVVAGDPVLIASQGGLNLYVGNGPGADGKTAAAPGDTGPMRRETLESDFRDNITLAGRRIAEAAKGRPLRGSEVSAYWLDRSVEAVVRDPGRWIGLMLRKTAYFLNGFEISDNKSLGVLQAESRWWISTPVRLGWVWPLALVGLVMVFKKRLFGNCVVWFLFLYGFSIILFFVNVRLRLPVVPAVLLFAAVGGSGLLGLVRDRRGAGPLVATLLAGAVVSGGRWFEIDDPSAERAHRLNRAVVLIESGECDEALRAFDEVIALDPGAVEGWFGKARALERCGREDRAVIAYRELRGARPGFAPGHLAAARLLSLRGEIGAADSAYAQAVAVAPELPDVYLNFASHLARTGRFGDAAEAYRQGLERDPGRLSSWIAYGYTLAALEQPDRAAAAWRRALSLDPDNPAALRGLRGLGALPGP